MNRRKFLSSSSAAVAGIALGRHLHAANGGAELTHKERVDRALRGEELDRPPFTFYHHYKRPTPQLEAQDHLAFHRIYKTDIVKVMNDFDYPVSKTSKWYELQPLESPFPDQLTTLQLVRDGLKGDAYFVDTIYGPYMTAMILFGKQPQYAGRGTSDAGKLKVIEDLRAFQRQNPDGWHIALEAITQSTIHHIRHTKDLGASGSLVSVFNAESRFGTVDDYERYTRPYDKRVFAALADTRLTTLHLHYLERPYLKLFADLPASVVQYSVAVSGIPISEFRKHYAQTILGGVDEVGFDKLTAETMRTQWTRARQEAGRKYIAAPGCSVPDASTAVELARFPQSLGIA